MIANLGSLGLLGNGGGRPTSMLPDNAPVTIPGVTMGDMRDEFAAFFAAKEGESAARDRLLAFLNQHGLLRDVVTKDEPMMDN